MKNTHVIYLLVISIIMCSCEQLIETELSTNQIPSDMVFENNDTAYGALSNLYAELQNRSVLSGGSNGIGALMGSYTDDLNCYIQNPPNASFDLYHNIHVSTNTTIKNVWTTAYKQIFMANSIIEGVEKSHKLSSETKNRIRSEAVFVRAILHYYLSQLFGPIPYVTSTDYTINQSISKNSEGEILLNIETDLQNIIPHIQDTYTHAERIYPNRKTVELFLAIVLVHQKKWNEAEVLVNGVLQSTLYSHENDYTKTFKKDGSHILWQLKPLKAGLPTQEANLYGFSTAAPINYDLSIGLVSLFSSIDQRRQHWISEVIIQQTAFYRNDKYRNIINNMDEYSIVFRLEEAFLLMAEIKAQQNQHSTSLLYLNAIRQKAGLNPINAVTTQDHLIQEILHEYRREFFAERAIRFLTLKRMNQLPILSVSKSNWQDYHSKWPIPSSEISLNPKLSPQNYGY